MPRPSTNRLLPISPGALPDTGTLPVLQSNRNAGNAAVGAAQRTTCTESYTTSRIANGAAERGAVYAEPVHPDAACRSRARSTVPVLNTAPASVYSASELTLSTTRKSQLGDPKRTISARTRSETSVFDATVNAVVSRRVRRGARQHGACAHDLHRHAAGGPLDRLRVIEPSTGDRGHPIERDDPL